VIPEVHLPLLAYATSIFLTLRAKIRVTIERTKKIIPKTATVIIKDLGPLTN